MQQRDYDIAAAFGARVMEAAGAAVAGVIAYGSRARGDHHPESDLDLAVIVHRREDVRPVHELVGPLQRGDISARVLTVADIAHMAAFIDNLRRDAVPVAGRAAEILAKPYSASPWDISRDEIALARAMLARMRKYDVDVHVEAVRHDAYYAMFRLARALLFARTGRAPYRHTETREALARFAQEDARWAAFSADLNAAAHARELDDYGPPGAEPPSAGETRAARDAALRWFETVTHALRGRGGS